MMVYNPIFKLVAKRHKRNKDIVILEIGVGRRAYSTVAFLEGLKERESEGELFSVDINIGKDGKQRHVEYMPKKFAESIGMIDKWTFINGDSKKIKWNKEVDVLFIDGDHSYDGAKLDYLKYEPFVKRGGLILMHDVFPKTFGVHKFWKEIKYPKVKLAMDRAGLGIIQKNES